MFYNMFFGDCYGNVTRKRAGNGGLVWNVGERIGDLFAFVYILKGNYRIDGYGRYI